MDFYAVIMAGGGGTRLWPLSRKNHPKQLLSIFGHQSLYQMAVARLQGVIDPGKIYVVTTAELYSELQPATPFLQREQFLLEPQPRGTASVVGLAATVLSLQNPQAVMAITTADHVIQHVDRFQELMRIAAGIASDGWLVTLGIQPTFPSTGFGYIQTGEVIAQPDGRQAYQVARFVEKPDLQNAQIMLASGGYLWNSGMFFWRVDVILAQFARWMPDLYRQLMIIRDHWQTPEREAVLNQAWGAIHPETIDYGIMEKADRVAVLPAEDLGWNDVGNWNSLGEVMPLDENKNVVLADSSLTVDTRATIIYEDNPEKLVATLGIQHIVVVDTPQALLVCSRENAQRIKELVQILKERNLDHYL